jgi:enamine deaminase RidA (YjgF/YER057c/UK114 family)
MYLRAFWIVIGLYVVMLSGTASAQGNVGPEAKLKALGIDVTQYEPRPLANYLLTSQVGNLLFVSGAGPRNIDGTFTAGKLGADITTDQGYQAARRAGLTTLAAIRRHLGSLDRVKKIVRVLGQVNATPDFKEDPKVLDGFSDLMVEVLVRMAEAQERRQEWDPCHSKPLLSSGPLWRSNNSVERASGNLMPLFWLVHELVGARVQLGGWK